MRGEGQKRKDKKEISARQKIKEEKKGRRESTDVKFPLRDTSVDCLLAASLLRSNLGLQWGRQRPGFLAHPFDCCRKALFLWNGQHVPHVYVYMCVCSYSMYG